jgi:MerR family mercuric resistance operon transcriptional regulator
LAQATTLSIGALSQLTGCNIETIRYYERIGVLPDPPRTEGGHRSYGGNHLKRLTFVRRSRELGFTLDEIRSLLGMVDGGDYTCGEVLGLAREHLGAIQAKIRDLKRLQQTLANIAAQCGGGAVPECPIIDALFRDGPP